MGDTDTTTMFKNLVMTSDISAALIGAGFANIYNLGSPGMYAVRSALVSIFARMLTKSTALNSAMPTMTDGSKNQLFVASIGALVSYFRKGNVMKGAISQSAIDLIAVEVLKTIGMEDKSLIGGT